MTALEGYLTPAQARFGWWRPLLGLAVILGFWIVGAIVVVFAWIGIEIAQGRDPNATLAALMEPSGGGIAITLLMLATFIGIWMGCWLVAVAIHRQPFMTLFSPDRRIWFGDFFVGLLLAAIFTSISLAVAIGLVGLPTRAQPMEAWLVFLAPIVILVIVQATAEELIFRGYLLQQLAIRFRSPLVWAALPALIFGLLHFANVKDPVHGAYYVAITFISGITLAALVWRTGALWMAVGMHVGINVLTLTIVGAEGIVAGTQLWLYPAEAIDILLPLDLVASIAMLVFVLSPYGRILGRAGGPLVTETR